MWCVKIFLVCACMLIALAHDEPEHHVCDQTYSMFQKLANQEAKISSLEENVLTLESALAGANECRHVALRATLTKSLGTVPLGQTIIYDKLELNIGNAYHPYHGIFTAPCNGTYLFFMKIGNANKEGVIHLKKNDVTVEYTWAGFSANWDLGGVATVVHLVAGDDIWVERRGSVDGVSSNDGVGDRNHVSFAGTLLHAF